MELKKLLFFFLVTGLILSGMYATKNNYLLKTAHAPHGIASFSFTPHQADQTAIINEWKASIGYKLAYDRDSLYKPVAINGLDTAVSQRKADFGFIIFYVLLLGALIYWAKQRFNGLYYGLVLAVLFIGGFLDALGNALELAALGGSTGLGFWIFAASFIKWLAMVFCVGAYYTLVLRPKQGVYLSRLNQFLSDLSVQLWKFRIVVIGLLVLYAVLNLVDQGKDLLVAIGDSLSGTLWFVGAIFVLAILNWYLPKIYIDPANLKQKGPGFAGPAANIQTYLGRLSGSVTLLIPATGLLAAMQTYHVPYWLDFLSAPLVFLLMLFFYFGLLHHKILDKFYLDKKGKFLEVRYWATFAVTLILSGGLAVCIGAVYWPLGCLSLIFFLLSFLFLLTVNYRLLFNREVPFLIVLYITSGFFFLMFLLFNFRVISAALTANNRFYSLPVFIAGMVFYTVLATGLLLLGRQLKFQLITVLILVMMVISKNSITKFHRVNTSAAKHLPEVKEESLRAYVRRWLESRREEIKAQSDAGKDYPVFFVNAYGGGIRAAAWTAMAVGRVNYLMRAGRDSISAVPDFEHYVFAYSGASGGTIGESLLAGARMHHAANPAGDKVFTDSLQLLGVFRHDYLTNDLVGIIGRDFLMGSFGLSCCPDRAKVTELAYESYLKKLNIDYDVPIRLGWHDPKMEVPLTVSNTFDINTARKGILAPVILRQVDFPGVLLIQDLLKGQDINFSSMAFLSARFPYVSPTGKFDEQHHFTDGGTIENSGAETSLQLIHVFNSIRDSLLMPGGKQADTIFKRLKICILSLPNSVPAILKVQRAENAYEVTAPILGILGTIGGNADKADMINKDSANIYQWPYFRMAPMDAKIREGEIHPILPLGWQISDYALEMMQVTAERDTSELVRVFGLFKNDFKKAQKTK